jgi:Mn-dependent DtxR family transcriptional regulator
MCSSEEKPVTDAEIARSLKASRKMAGIYRRELQKLGLLKIRDGIWTVGYTSKSQRNT